VHETRPSQRQRHDLYAKYHDYDSEISVENVGEIHPICPLQARTLWVIHETRPSQPSTPCFI
jgi:hypothetical protein